VLRRLCASEAGSRLPAAVRNAAAELEAACGTQSVAAAHRQLTSALQELHGAIVTVDHGLGESPASVAVGAGEFLRQAASLPPRIGSHANPPCGVSAWP
jgi:hypothetical protein